MKRSLLIPLIVLVLVTMACSFGKASQTAAPAEPNQPPAVESEKATEAPAPVESEPTDTVEAAKEPEAAPTDTEAPPEAPAGSGTFTDSFDQANDAWTDPLIVTTQASGRDPYVKVTAGDGTLRFAITDKETYVYKFLNQSLDGATVIETDFQNKNAINTGIALVCKANEEHTSWYELRVSAGDYNYIFYKYDKKIKEEQDKNPYVQLGKGHMKADEYFATKPNHVVFTCTDSELSVDVNNGKKKASQTIDNSLEGNLFGLGVMSADIKANTIDFETVTIR